MKWCERCGGPLRAWDWCQLCWLDRVSKAQDWSPGDRRLAAWVEWADQPGLAHAPCPHASGWWLPQGARERPRPPLRSTSDEAALLDWLARYAWDVPVGERFVHIGGQWT